MARPTPIPIRVETHADIPRKLVRLYEADGTGFVLTNPGKVLSIYRDAIAKDPSREPGSYKQPLSRADWQLLVRIAEPERAHFLKCAATKRIRIA